jgi:hypothetical protein
MLEGCYHLPRFIDKTRLHLAGNLAPEYERAYCHPRGLDGTFLGHFGIGKDTIIGAIRDLPNDAEVGTWFVTRVADFEMRRSSWELLAPRLGLPGEPMHDVLLWAMKNVYIECRDPAIDTVFKVLDWDEGRLNGSGRKDG